MAEILDHSSADGQALLSQTVRRAAEGDDAAFASLAAKYEPTLRGILSPLQLPEADQRDLFQEGLIGLYKAVLLYDPKLSSFSTFASVCMRSGVMNGLRKYQKDHSLPELDLPAEEIPDGAADPERILMGKEELTALLGKVDRVLSSMERRVFGLHLQGKKAAEIASLLGKDIKSVENTLFRARRKLSTIS